eukprot:m.50673 g.50673  ORF g.50673 m.50673 type:complete len:289 (+) comp12563_c0_seq1:548-1414(+)
MRDQGSTASRREAPILSGMLHKRAQGRSTFGRTNWKKRWFALYPGELSYWTLEGGPNNPAAECKGVVNLANVYALERVSLESFGKPHMFQIVHTSVLYVQCPSREDCDDWLLALRKQCKGNRILHSKYHPGCFDGSRWTCCNISSKDYKGCQKAFDYTILPHEDGDSPVSANVKPTKKKSASQASDNGVATQKSAPRTSLPNTSSIYNGNTSQSTSNATSRKASSALSDFGFSQDRPSAKTSRDFSYIPSVKPIKHTSSPLRQSLNPPSSAAAEQQPVVVRVTRVAYV